MKHCLRVLEQIQPATMAQWKTECYGDLPKKGMQWLMVDADVAVSQCIEDRLAIPEDAAQLKQEATTFRLAASLPEVLHVLAAM